MKTIELQRGPSLPPTLADLWWAGPKPRAVAWVLDGQVLRDAVLRAAWPAGVAAVGVHGTANRDAEYAHATDPRQGPAHPRGWLHAAALCDAARTLDLSSIGIDERTPRVLVGASLGGLQAMCTAIVAPELWAGVVALSPSVGWALADNSITAHWIERVGNRCALYADAGGATEADDNRWSVNLLGDRLALRDGLAGTECLDRWQVRTFPGEPHAWSAWRERVGPAINWVLDTSPSMR